MRFAFLFVLVIFLSACVNGPLLSTDAPSEPIYSSEEQRLLDNVRIKKYDEFGITYEYKNVRIDEIAYMASEYCHSQNGKKAFLHDSQLFKNFSRRATFHCL